MLTNAEKRPLSPQDLLVAELAILKGKEQRIAQSDDYRVFYAAQNLEDNGSEDDDAPVSVYGRIAYRNRKSHKDPEERLSIVEIFMAQASITLTQLQKLLQTGSALLLPIQSAAGEPQKITDAEKSMMRSFETARVTPETEETLDAESKLINDKLAMLYATYDTYGPVHPDKIKKLETEIETLASVFRMALHPQKNIYVHDIMRVAALELIHNPHDDPRKCTGCVNVFRIHAHGVESRGIRVKVGDQYDQKPTEIIASGDHLKGQDAPSFQHS